MDSNVPVGANQQGSQNQKYRSFTRKHLEKIKLHCRVCNREFEVPFHERNERKTCGEIKCFKAWQSINQSQKVFKICPICGSVYKVKKSYADRKQKTCSNPICTKKYRGQEIGWIKIAPHLIARKWIPEYRIDGNGTYYRLDFAKPDKRLAIYIDERNHFVSASTRARDKEANQFLEENGWKVIRLAEERIIANLEDILNEILIFDPSETTRR